MKRGAKRTSRENEDVPESRTRLEITAEEEEARRRQQAGNEESDDSWEDDDDDEVYEEYMEGSDEEEIVDEAEDDDDEYTEFQKESAGAMGKAMKSISFADVSKGGDDGDDEGGAGEVSVWRNDLDAATPADGEQVKLEYSNKAYDAFFQLRTEYPCLSFDVMRDNKESHTKYPLSTLLVCGTQADELAKNELLVLYVSNMCRTKHDVESDQESEDSYIGDGGDSQDGGSDEDEEEVNNGEPVVHHRTIAHHGTANRVRLCPQNNPNGGSQMVAVWSDAGHVQVFDVESELRPLVDFSNWSKEQMKAGAASAQKKKGQHLKFCTPSSSHRTEGYGLDWSPVQSHVFASGDCNGALYAWQPTEDGRWASKASNTTVGTSIEEIQWSPTQADVLIAARAGGLVEVWDVRDMRSSKLSWQADATDINVADWNRARQASHLLVTGADSGAVAVWDLRKMAQDPIQRLSWHSKSITSVEFSLHNESVLSVTSDDGQCTLWDLSLERDPSEEQEVIGELFGRADLVGIPDQLMFQHQGLFHPKEAHWHPQIPGMVFTTDYEGLHLFRPMNWRSLMK